jgi:hypothetical protein
MHRISLAIGSILFCVSNGSTKTPENASHTDSHYAVVVPRQPSPAEPPEDRGAKPHATPVEPTGVRNGIDWSTLDITKWREHTSGNGMKFHEYDVHLADSKDVIQVLCAEPATDQDSKFKYKDDNKTPLGLEITYNCVSHAFDARGITCKGETRIRDFWIANDSFAKIVNHNCVEEKDDRKAKAALEAGKRVYIVYKTLDDVMQHIAVMKTISVPYFVATSESTCDSKPGAYPLALATRIDTIQPYFSQTLIFTFYIGK